MQPRLAWFLVLGLAACPAEPAPPAPVDAAPETSKPSVVAPAAPVVPKPMLPDVLADSVLDAGADALAVTDGGFIVNPGKPVRLFGPKCWGYFGFDYNGLLGQDFNVEDCTAYTHSADGRSQVYLHFGRLPDDVQSAYASVLLPLPGWRPGSYSTALAGRIEVVLKDGRRYRLDLSSGVGGTGVLAEMLLRIDTVSGVQPDEPSHYVKGAFDAELSSVGGGMGPPKMVMHIQIDTSAAPGPEPTWQMVCTPGLPGAVNLRTRCNLGTRNGTPYAYCQQLGGVGGIGLHVLDLGRAKAGAVVPLGGASPALRVDGQYTSRNDKPLVVPGSETGSFLIYELVPEKVLRGRFINATVGVGSARPATCRIDETAFEATVGNSGAREVTARFFVHGARPWHRRRGMGSAGLGTLEARRIAGGWRRVRASRPKVVVATIVAAAPGPGYPAGGICVLLPDLLQRFVGGDSQAFLAVYEAHAGDLRPLVARFFATPFEREEALQEIWLQVHRAASSFDPARGAILPWLRALAVNRCREILRARGRRPALGEELAEGDAAEGETPETLAQRERLQAAITRFLATLTEEEAGVFRLALLEERAHDEVARVLGISVRRAKYLKLKLLDRAAASPLLRAVVGEVGR